MALWLFPMDQEQFEEVSTNVAERLEEHVRATFDYYQDNFPGLKRKPGRERLAFYRSTDQSYWNNLTMVNPQQAKFNLLDWMALSRREMAR